MPMTTVSETRFPVLADEVWHGRSLTRAVMLTVGGTLALAASAKIQVSLWPVPLTMQSLIVLLIGIAYGSRLAAITVLAYLVEGLAGLPVLAGAAAGPAYMAGPTAGYLVGFLLAATGVGWLAERGWDRSLGLTAAAMLLGHALLIAPGVIWLATLFGWDRAVAVGLLPFLAGTVVKSALGAALVRGAWPMLGRRTPGKSSQPSD